MTDLYSKERDILRRILAAILLVSPLLVGGCELSGRSRDMARLEAAGLTPDRAAMAEFVFGDFGGLSGTALETNALPFKVVCVAMLTAAEAPGETLGRADLPRLFGRYGFVFPQRMANWEGAQPKFQLPIGMVSAELGAFPGVRIEAANMSCAACHAGVLYDAQGRPTRDVWLGLPNSSLNLETYTRAVYDGLRLSSRDRDRFGRRIESTYPEMGWRERLTLRWLLLPRIERRLSVLESTLRSPAPFSNGGAGRTNGVGSLKNQLGLLDRASYHPDIGTTSIPALAFRGFRSSLLYDGCYAVPGEPRFVARAAADDTPSHRDALAAIVAFFTVPIMGVTPERAERSIPEARRVMGFLSRTTPPRFPGAVDESLVPRGRGVYEHRCAGCHGVYAGNSRPFRLIAFPNRLIAQSDMGTDSSRWHDIDSPLISRLEHSVMARHVAADRTGGYVAPILSGLWATAPYLHNGSVPTVWHLMHPEARPARFQVGGHRLDFDRMGIAGTPDSAGDYRYPAGYRPWTEPELYDNRRPGLSNRGHVREFIGLDLADERALLEFLKCL